jgi:hypothetical protein
MWQYTEEVEEDEEQKKKKVDEQSSEVKQDNSGKGEGGDKSDKTKRVVSRRPEREVFCFSIESPWKSKQSRKESVSEKAANKSSRNSGEKHNWVPSKEAPAKAEPAGKRVRLS